jgi:transmembrane sensor
MKQHQSGSGDGSPVVTFPETKSIQARASEWMAKLDGGEPTPAELNAFRTWVNEDSAHRQAMDEMIEFWGDMNVLTQIVLPREKLGNRKVRTPSLWPWSSAVAAMLVIAVAFWYAPELPNNGPLTYTTKVGEQKTIELPDHTTVFLNTNSRIEVSYSDQRRGLKLVRGEAHFDVFHQPSLPFEVNAGGVLVRAIGTAFSVQIRKINIEVVVTEGTVEVDAGLHVSESSQTNTEHLGTPTEISIKVAEGSAAGGRLQVTAGSMVTFDGDQIEQVKLLVEKQIEEKLSWRQGLLVFKNEPLQKLVAEMSRYTKLEIIIPERKARELKVGGIFKVGDTESMFEALREGFGIHAQYVSDDLVYLISAENRLLK